MFRIALWVMALSLVACKTPPVERASDPVIEADTSSASLPPLDSDRDGVPDEVDVCVDEPEDDDGFEASDGCPDLDNDADGWLDAEDACPDEAEVINGVEDDDGCPDEGEPAVRLEEDRIVLTSPIAFEIDKAHIRHKSYATLDQLVTLLERHPEIEQLRIEGHRDDNPEWIYRSMKITQRRAESVMQYLIEHGIERNRLVAVGFGPDRPIVPNDTPENRALNRRIELWILARTPPVLRCRDAVDCPPETPVCEAGRCTRPCGCVSDADCAQGDVCRECLCVGR